ncbi:UMP kinase [Candidatus Pacearchaeota archaeon]|nr:UMP kinase [Candidatus Pacearchaeota archaeon]
MKKEVVVISLGGSQILKNGKINIPFLLKFKKIILKHSKKKKFIIVTGGGSIARIYINGLKKINASIKLQSFAGISVTRHNARFMSYFFGQDQLDGVPHTLEGIKRLLNKEKIVFAGGLQYKPDQTSDGTAASIAKELGGVFINITNVDGLYNKNPLEYKDAKFIPYISWKDFHSIVSKIDFKPGQHFVLDQNASKTILDSKIKTYIIGDDLRNLDKLLYGKSFRGTSIYG